MLAIGLDRASKRIHKSSHTHSMGFKPWGHIDQTILQVSLLSWSSSTEWNLCKKKVGTYGTLEQTRVDKFIAETISGKWDPVENMELCLSIKNISLHKHQKNDQKNDLFPDIGDMKLYL